MTFVRANALGWGLYEVLTSSQITLIDEQVADAVDGTGGEYDGPLIFNDLEATIPTGNVVEWGASNYPRLTSRSIPRFVDLGNVLAVSNNIGGTTTAYGQDWACPTAGLYKWTQQYTNASIRPIIVFSLDEALIDGATLIGYGMMVGSARASGAGSGTIDPRATLKKLECSSNADLGSFPLAETDIDVDTASSFWVNGVTEGFQAAGLSEVINKGASSSVAGYYRYSLKVEGEAGSGALGGMTNGFFLLALRIYQTVTEIRP